MRRAVLVLTWTVGAISILLCGVSLVSVLAQLGRGQLALATAVQILPPAVGIPLVYATIGTFVASRRPANPMGWLFCFAGACAALGGAAGTYAAAALFPGPPPAAATVAAWIDSWYWVPLIATIGIALPLLYPEGRLLTPRWRLVVWSGAGGTILALIGRALEPGPIGPSGYDENPFAPPSAGQLFELALGIGMGLVVLSLGSAVLSLVLRLRRSRGIERQQLKWFVFAAALFPPLMVAGIAGSELAQTLFLVAATALPIATAIAALRYRLYAIDILINRTLVDGPTTAAIALTFFGGIVVLQTVLRPLTGGSELAVAVSTLACFALFQPLRRRIQSVVDRRFYRSRYDATRTLDEFGTRLRDEVDLDAVRADLLDAVAATVEPTAAPLWIR